MIFAEVIYKKRTIICKKQTWFVFLWFFQFPLLQTRTFSLFLSSPEIRGTEILVFPLSKGFFSIYYKKKEKFLLYLRKGKTPSLSKERKIPLNKNQEDSFFPSSFNKPSACRAFRSQYGLYYNRSVRKPYCNHTCARYRRGRGGDSAILF